MGQRLSCPSCLHLRGGDGVHFRPRLLGCPGRGSPWWPPTPCRTEPQSPRQVAGMPEKGVSQVPSGPREASAVAQAALLVFLFHDFIWVQHLMGYSLSWTVPRGLSSI